ncbi:hypothetical protein NDU88_010980 [Pleurodeles waltl]|uniref:Uncharacterized protein n=1 Tax=Pleurodeles waltl TaxID=8319 RepID=A0AAV7QXB1_PLEWA|nr:hypothetical protein NDU88_010980 [Pleurodeles waltl]
MTRSPTPPKTGTAYRARTRRKRGVEPPVELEGKRLGSRSKHKDAVTKREANPTEVSAQVRRVPQKCDGRRAERSERAFGS